MFQDIQDFGFFGYEEVSFYLNYLAGRFVLMIVVLSWV